MTAWGFGYDWLNLSFGFALDLRNGGFVLHFAFFHAFVLWGEPPEGEES